VRPYQLSAQSSEEAGKTLDLRTHWAEKRGGAAKARAAAPSVNGLRGILDLNPKKGKRVCWGLFAFLAWAPGS